MAKWIITWCLALLSCTMVSAQQTSNQKWTLALSAGPSFPVGSFGAKDLNKDPEAGLANVGLNFNLQLGYYFEKNFGLVGTFLYSKYTLDNSALGLTNVSTDHWQYYGMLVGPLFSLEAGKRFWVDFKFLIGVTNVNSPVFSASNSVIVNEDWAAAFTFQVGASARYDLNQNLFLVLNTGFVGMKPTFKLTEPTGNTTVEAEQKVSAIDVTAGIGVRF